MASNGSDLARVLKYGMGAVGCKRTGFFNYGGVAMGM